MKITYDKNDIIRLCKEETKRQCPELQVELADYDSLYQRVTIDMVEPGKEVDCEHLSKD